MWQDRVVFAVVVCISALGLWGFKWSLDQWPVLANHR